MARFAARLAFECGHVQAIVVDEFQAERGVLPRGGNEQDVAVLDVAVRHAGFAQPPTEPHPQRQHRFEDRGAIEVVVNELVDRVAIDPLHLHDRVFDAANADAFGLEIEPDGKR